MRPIHNWATAVVAGALVLTVAGTASAATVYNNIPSPLAGNYASQAFEATSTAEFGGLVELAAGARTNPVVTVTLSSWGCQNRVSGACVTTPGSAFSHPITLNIYFTRSTRTTRSAICSPPTRKPSRSPTGLRTMKRTARETPMAPGGTTGRSVTTGWRTALAGISVGAT
jgi:hypothetical protein